MQRVRWRPLYASVFALVQIVAVANSQMQDAMSISEDGWRPIVGTSRRQPSVFDSNVQYKNPSQNVKDIEVIKSETPISFSSTASPEKSAPKARNPVPEIHNKINTGNLLQLQGEKIPPHTKFTSPGYHTLPALMPHHVPPGAVTISRPSQFGIKKPLIIPTPPPFFGQKRKPLRGPAASHSIRSEVYVQPPNPGFSLIKGPIKVREAQGLSLLGNGHYSINQPNGHIEFNRFIASPTNDDIFQQFKSQPVYVFTKPSPAELKKQADDYTRNLVPPPPLRFLQDKEKKFVKTPIKFEDNVATVTQTVPKLQEFGIKQQHFRPSQIQENLVTQPALQHDKFKVKEQAVDVQVTKEKFKVFHNNIPTIRNPAIVDYVDYDYHSLPAPVQQPKLQTYEVTEGKWIDNPNPYTFSFPPHTQQPAPQKIKQLVTATPQLITEPIVELNVPPFLPTPYKPDAALPTSATQSEVSTIFSQISAKMNKYKNEQLQTNPLFFNVKEVSTHYPILGKPAFAAEQSTNKGEVEFTTLTSMEDGTQKPKTRRRRPQPRKPTIITTTSTTTEETITENQDFQKIVDNTEMPVETERPRKRQRLRPNSFRDSEEKPRHTTTAKHESEEYTTEKSTRGKHRFRQRGNYASTNNNDIRTTTRKRLRPKLNSMSNNKMSDSDTPLIHQNRFTEPSIETQGSYESKYTEEILQIRQPTVEDDISKEQNTPINNEESDSEPEETTEQIQHHDEKNSTPLSKDTTLENILPVNEVDYSTETPTLEYNEEETTTMPTTTTETTSTTKLLRTRNKLKYSSSNRPRFSVKEYRQRLNQYTTTTPSTTTDFIKTTAEGARFRFPSRLRTRPTQTTTTQVYQAEEPENTEPIIQRRRFRPKDSRYSSSTSTEVSIIRDSSVKAVNTHLRPFGGHRTTEATVSSKVSIRPNLFSARRRPSFTLRHKQNKTEETTGDQENEVTEPVTHATTTEEEKGVSEVNAEFQVDKAKEEEEVEEERTTAEAEPPETTMTDINEDDYSKRVSDLTSSFKNEYDTPGLFKSVSPNSRRIPNYFTIATDDPILPIEAFFPSIKDRDKE